MHNNFRNDILQSVTDIFPKRKIRVLRSNYLISTATSIKWFLGIGIIYILLLPLIIFIYFLFSSEITFFELYLYLYCLIAAALQGFIYPVGWLAYIAFLNNKLALYFISKSISWEKEYFLEPVLAENVYLKRREISYSLKGDKKYTKRIWFTFAPLFPFMTKFRNKRHRRPILFPDNTALAIIDKKTNRSLLLDDKLSCIELTDKERKAIFEAISVWKIDN